MATVKWRLLSTAQFSVVDVHMNDLIETPELLDCFVGLAFVGGFSCSDTFDRRRGSPIT